MTKLKIVLQGDMSDDSPNTFPRPTMDGDICHLGALIATHMRKNPKLAAAVTIAANIFCLEVGANPGELEQVFLSAKAVADDREAKQN